MQGKSCSSNVSRPCLSSESRLQTPQILILNSRYCESAFFFANKDALLCRDVLSKKRFELCVSKLILVVMYAAAIQVWSQTAHKRLAAWEGNFIRRMLLTKRASNRSVGRFLSAGYKRARKV